ncbi:MULTISPECIES: hypothetical protein [Streptomyces]|uniref:hypothetical protein n=1 Tax=Streptomyces TaxID=1883 RepID=UPI00069B71F1|nr:MULTISPECIES: hypothetical protein [Streptomyces]MYU51217.1 hypothetical protein [Streptomyces sp. SID7805]
MELRAALEAAGLDLPELYVDYGGRHLVHLGKVSFATARELARIVQAAHEPFHVGAAVVDTTRSKVAKILAVNGECLVLSRPVGDPWDALVTWCRPATLGEALSLTAFQEPGVGELTEITRDP